MASVHTGTAAQGMRQRLLACVSRHGSAAHPYSSSDALLRGPESTRNLADAVAFLCNLHGRTPGIIAYAAGHTADEKARLWLGEALDSFARERSFLARLAVEVGPAPVTRGSAGAEATLHAQRHSLDMLARSERSGCGLGAAVGLLADWATIRFVLNTAAGRVGLVAPASIVPDEDKIADIAAGLAHSPGVERALLFGTEQLCLQHHGLWDILEARQLAREAA
mgnify:CR=1 FL=1